MKTSSTETSTVKRPKSSTLTTADVARLFDGGYREVEVLPDGRVREVSPNGDHADEVVTRTLKTKRTWY